MLAQRFGFPPPLPCSPWGAEQEQTSCETAINNPTSQKKRGEKNGEGSCEEELGGKEGEEATGKMQSK